MAGANYVLDKGFYVPSTYNSSSANGVTAYRCVVATSVQDTCDLQTSAGGRVLGVVQEAVDRAKVATGKVAVGVRLLGITKVYVAASGTAPTYGAECKVSTDGGVIAIATGTGHIAIGICLTQGSTNGDLIDMLIVQGGRVLA